MSGHPVTREDRETYLRIFGKIAEHEEYHVRKGDFDKLTGMQAIAGHRVQATEPILAALSFLADAAAATKGFASPLALRNAQRLLAENREVA